MGKFNMRPIDQFLSTISDEDCKILAKSLDQHGQLGLGRNGIMDPEQLAKALDATTTTSMTDLSQLTGGRAITVENLDTVLKITAENRDELVLWNLLRKPPIGTVLDQYTTLDDWGTDYDELMPFGSYTDEASFPSAHDITLARRVGRAKFIRDLREDTHVLRISKTFEDPLKLLNEAAAIRCLGSAEKGLYFGDSDVIPNEFDGLIKILLAQAAAGENTVIDCRKTGASSNSLGAQITESQIDQGAMNIRNAHGAASDMVFPIRVKKDINDLYEDTRRVMTATLIQNQGSILAGMNIDGIFCEFADNGKIKFHHVVDSFLPCGDSTAMRAPAASKGDAPTAPSAVTVTAEAAGYTGSLFGAGDAGTYRYKVVAITENGRSAAVAGNAAATIDATGAGKLVITSDTTPRGFYIYRGAMDGAAGGDYGYVAKIVRTSTSTTWYDVNSILPGTGFCPMITNGAARDAIDIRRLLQFTRLALTFGLNKIVGWPYLYLLYMYLRVQKPRQHVLFKNVKYSGSEFA